MPNGNITEGVTTLFTGGPAIAESWKSAPSVNSSNGNVTLTWSSLEGGSYQVEASTNLTNWTPIATDLPAGVGGTQSTFTENAAALMQNNNKRFYRLSRTGVATYSPAFTGQ